MYSTIEEVFEAPFWNLFDQDYWCAMAGFGFPTSMIIEKYRWIIENGYTDTYEQLYAEYLANKEQQA